MTKADADLINSWPVSATNEEWELKCRMIDWMRTGGDRPYIRRKIRKLQAQYVALLLAR